MDSTQKPLSWTNLLEDYIKKGKQKTKEQQEEEVTRLFMKNLEEEKKSEDNSLSMTREMKYHTKQISTDPLIEQVMPNSDLSLDLFEDLKPTGNTIVTKPITEEQQKPKVEENFYSSDTSDIDVIKNTVKKDNRIDNDFYTSSYKFSKK